ncbi:MAG: ribose uptake protein RbsU [Acetilactobacillus jinshanensis]
MLITLLPALLWGFTPVWVHYLGGKPIQQLLGTTYGGLIIGLLIFLIMRPHITLTDFFWCCIGGACWSVGQLAQYHAYNRLSVSTTSPINSGVQLVGVNIVGVLFFGSWSSSLEKIIGFSAVALIILGVFISTRGGKKKETVRC